MSEKFTAPQAAMEGLHADLVTELSERVRGIVEEIEAETDEEGKVIKPARVVKRRATAAELAVAAKVLKDNSIFSSPEVDSKVKDLQDAVDARQKARKPSAQDKDDALATLSRELLQ